jgi:Flp pilus assembly protein TadG
MMVRYVVEERGNAAIETVVLFPLLASLLIGSYDLGLGILINQKTIGASQIIGDLVARNRAITMDGLTDMIKAGELAFEPYSTASFGYDIASIQFDSDGKPIVLWRVTNNMEPNDTAIDSTEGLGPAGEGVVVVTTAYEYDPYFSHFVVPAIDMQEVAFLKGRKSGTVACGDCPS